MSNPPPSPERHNRLEPGAALRANRRGAQEWARTPLAERLRTLRDVRHLLLDREEAIVAASPRPAAEFISSELIPLADACRFLERQAPAVLRPRKLGRRGRPGWLRGHSAQIERIPCGAVLVIAPSNYPLLLPGVQALQALAAGNAVTVKPGAGGSWAAELLAEIVAEAGCPDGSLTVLDESAQRGADAVAAGFDRIVFTGSANTGRKVLAGAAQTLSPATVELSGCDAAVVLPGADLGRAVQALAFGITLNEGSTCIAPRRIFVHRSQAAELRDGLAGRLAELPPVELAPATVARLAELSGGLRPLVGGFGANGDFAPALYGDLCEDHPLGAADLFAPFACLMHYDETAPMIEAVNRCPYGLGASVFGDQEAATALASQLDVGTVTINDVIVPTADPRLPFGGRGESGFGTTRGAEGLLEMTRPKVITKRRGRWLPHLEPPNPGDAELLSGYLRLAHGATLRARLAGLKRLMRAIRLRNTKNTNDLDS